MDTSPDLMWQSVLAVIGVLAAVIIPVVVYLKQRQNKLLTFEQSSTPLLSIEEGIRSHVQITFDGKPVEQVHLVVVKITNSGNVPIEKKDYDHPIYINLGKDAKILTAEVAEKYPENLEVSTSIVDKNVVLEPALLSEDEFITLIMMATNFDKVTFDSRIVGVKGIQEVTMMKEKRLAFWAIFGILIEAFGAITATLISTFWSIFFWLISLIGATIGLIACIMALLSRRRKPRKICLTKDI
jgi:hypothetical protein